ncbi:Down syndrome cell adhesion molecule-like protein Dscam2 isoform X8 [Vanessa cardui]|uniref:Down syndrome cell adhesion molecule-like protein Dscam2 isoform X8 n=1 Tax=Vanessa cardui TaxID=171605 RepID=UPI001F12F8D1|nr:Down syndrome cell adhesion molecule-like protein Dscam2 isoform X8 [Vanessa cardui]
MAIITGFTVLVALLAIGAVHCEDETIGPIFMKEPPNRVDFSNTTGAVVECAARGSPTPDVIWVRADGTAVGDVPGLRQVLPNGNLVFPPFRAEDYRQEVHAQVYACLATNPVGSIHSRDVNVRAVVSQAYAVNLMEEYVLRGNAAILKCHIPSFVSEYVNVVSWIISEVEEEVEIKLESDNNNSDEGKYLVLPSGELHIRDVGPEDGYKSYQCRTKHRLTGETRLSATKGRLVITEPMGKVSPKFPTLEKSRLFNYDTAQTMSLLCPAQAFPAPMFRAYGQSITEVSNYGNRTQFYFFFKYLCDSTLPGSSLSNSTIQNPWVAFRLNLQLLIKVERLMQTNEKISHFCAPPKLFLPRLSEPVGRVPPKFPTMDSVRGFGSLINSSVTLLCPAQAFPVPLSRWYKFIDGSARKQPVVLNDRVKQVSGTLIIKEAKVEDSGKYLCVVNNSVGGESVETVLTVTAPLKSTVEPATQTVDFGRPAVFTCRYEGNPVKTITWLKDGKDMNHHDPILRIESVKKEDKGMYQCFIRNDQESAGASAELKLGGRFEPPQIRHSFGEQTLRSGPSLRLKCVASGNPTPDIAWQLDGDKLNSGERLQIGQFVTADGNVESHLNISSVHTNDGGLYSCIASSKVGSASHAARVNVYGLPYVRVMKKRPVVAGDTLVAHCPVAGYPIDSIVWERDGRVLPINRKQKVFPNGTLVIENVERTSDQATYTCVAKNSQGYNARGTLELQVMVVPQVTPFDFGDDVLNAGDTVSLTCTVGKGDLPLKIHWHLNDKPLNSGNGLFITRNGKRISVLSIENVQHEHIGNYTCIAENEAGRSSHSAILNVNVPPRWILEPTDKAFAQGSDAKVECKADGFPKPQVTWKRAEGDTPGDYKDLKPNNPNVKVEDGTLTIANIQKTNEGYYLCEAVNGIGSGLSAVILISVQAPPQFEIKMRNQTARRSEPAVLQCQAKGEKPIGIIWNMNNKRLEPKSDPRYTIREEILPGGVVSDLSIRRTERSDSALFTCVATNAFGSDDTSINMIIQEVPEAPYGLKVLDKSGRTVQLSWAAPYDGNSPIKKFLIEYKRAKGNWEKDIDRVLVPGDATEAGVFSLRPATAYHIRIVAENELGTSEPSETVTIITAEEAPTGMPQDVKVDAVDKHTLRVTWKPPQPQDWNGELQGYYVGYKLASSNKSFVFETVDISKESGKEHHLDIFNLKTYTQYAIVVQTFNKMGSGPVSNEVRAYTAEGAPSAPPQDVLCTTLTAQTIRVSWVSPPLAAANGLIKSYKVIYGPSETWYDEKTKDTKITASSETILHGLKKFTNYSMEVLATTNGGDGVRSVPIHCQTEQDVPEAPRAVKALVMGADSILVSWRPPAQPNGVVTHYNVYTQAQNAEPHPNKVPASQTSYSATDLKAGRYDFWVTASTIIGEGQPSATASCSPSDKVPAKIASFDESFTATYKEDVKLPCLAVGVPPPNILWKVKGHPLEASERVRQLPEGSLQIAGVAREDAGEYSCHVDNQFGTDTVTHTLSVLAPPFPPQLSIASSSVSSLTLRLKPSLDAAQSPAAGYTIHYKQEFGDWETVQIPSNTDTYTLENLFCGSRYQLYVTAYNGIGTGEASDVVIARTRGSKPPVPRAADFIEVGSSSVTLHLKQWLDGGCPMSHFVVENKKKGAAEWNQISNAVKPGGNFVVLDLEPATWYVLRITAHNNAGFNVAEYEFATLTMTGGTIAPVREVGDGALTPEQTLKIILSHLNLIVPVVAAVLVIIIAIVVVCVVRGARDHPHKDDAVYSAAGALGGAGGTLDKRGGLRDELGYIAPPNRKLPPVPGSNYNTCDRVKRQAVIMGAHSTWDPRRHHYERVRRLRRAGSGDTLSTGMEDEICPYATFHLLGFREEMDPSKAIAFPHHHPSHAGTLAHPHPHPHPHHPAHSRAGSQSMPRANSRYARKNSQGGQSAIYSTAPEYDDPATCAEEDQYRARYSRPMYACGPEYDEPACCAPEDEQYTGAYGTPYSDHYGSRPSIGTRKCGSPEPPPPPPRNANTENNCSSSFNESKDSNEISEAECDQPRNYPVRAHTAKDGLHSDEMRKLIDRPESNTPIPQQAVHGRGGLTAYDTVAV